MLDVLPAITETSWEAINDKLNRLAGLSTWVHIDVADNTLTAGTTFLDFTKFRAVTGGAMSFEAHLLVGQPEKYVRALADAGFKRVIVHVEAEDPRHFMSLATYEDMEVGIGIDLTSEIELLEPFLEEVDFALIQTNEAGYDKQAFQDESLEKIRAIHGHFHDLPLEAA